MPEVAVIIPTHNRREMLLECLAHVQAMIGLSHRAVVVFDGCTDGSQEAVRAQFPGTVIVEGDGNLWWSGAINAGLEAGRRLGATRFLLLNDDVVPAPNMLAALVHMAEMHPGALIGSKVYYLHDRNRLWGAGGLTDWRGRGAIMRANGCLDGPEWSEPARVHWFPGMGTLIPAEVLDRIGMMDARAFPQYFGDTDFSLRAHRAGIPLWVCPEARLYNDVESTGTLLPPGAIDLRMARTVLFSIRSHANLRTRFRFWRRHCLPWLIPWQAARFYGPLLAAIVKKLTWDRMRRPREARKVAV